MTFISANEKCPNQQFYNRHKYFTDVDQLIPHGPAFSATGVTVPKVCDDPNKTYITRDMPPAVLFQKLYPVCR